MNIKEGSDVILFITLTDIKGRQIDPTVLKWTVSIYIDLDETLTITNKEELSKDVVVDNEKITWYVPTLNLGVGKLYLKVDTHTIDANFPDKWLDVLGFGEFTGIIVK